VNRFTAWLPDRIDRRVRVAAWLSFLAQTIIIATGGAVRLTGSGLGCPTWPLCTEDSLVTTPEMGIHGIIEFGNRLMTGVVGIVALLVVLSIWRLRHERRDLWRLALVVVLGIVAQAVVGGITVWTGLNPFIVGFHYVASLLLVCVTAAYLVRLDAVPGPRELAVPRWYAALAHATTAVLGLTIVFGVLTTASGLVVTARRLRLPTLGWGIALLAIELVQIAVGLYQARNGLPPLLVGIHMVLAALTAATMTVFVLRLKRPATTDAAASDAALAASAR
jgi:cytochrome c oxidase assembly protein subunit 15